jgi:hypothetical protein
MIVNGDGQRLLRDVLPNDVLVEGMANVDRLRHADSGRLASSVLVQLLVEDAFADVDATVANVDARTGDEFAHLCVAFAAEGAHGEVGSARHNRGLN